LNVRHAAGPEEYLRSDAAGIPPGTAVPDELAHCVEPLPDAVRRQVEQEMGRARVKCAMRGRRADQPSTPLSASAPNKKNRELQRLPSEAAQRGALKQHYTSVSSDEYRGMLHSLLKMLQAADALDPPRRGPKPKRAVLIQILEILTANNWPLHTGKKSTVARKIGGKIGRSPEQAADLIHQLQDMAEKLTPLDPT
jgi:hypothetical protein